MSNLDSNRKISSLSDQEFERYWKAIEKNEDWEIGNEDFIEKEYISGVHKKNGVIIEYLILRDKKSIWISKQEAIKLTIEERLHATLVHLRSGNHYLRPEYGQHGFTIIT